MQSELHTNGPWNFDGDSLIIWGEFKGNPLHIATVRGWGTLQYEPNGKSIQEANGRLLAAAPELLQALKACRDKIAYMQTHGEWYSPNAAIEQADAIIA